MDEGTEGKAVMGNWEPAARPERGRVGNPPPRIAGTKVLLYWAPKEMRWNHVSDRPPQTTRTN